MDSCILIVDDTPKNIQVLGTILKSKGFKISFAQNGKQALEIVPRLFPDLILLDVMMPELDGYETCRCLKENEATKDIPIIFLSALAEVENKTKGFSLGGVDYITKPFTSEEVLARVDTHLKISRLTKELKQSNQELQQTIHKLKQEKRKREKVEKALHQADQKISILSEQEARHWGISNFIGKSRTVAKVLEDVRRLQNFDTPNVLLLGESGTGKELIARALHFSSSRAKESFIPINCCSIPHDLFESTCFGHVQGAFTGATSNRKGLFECADKGTIFLDEIGDMPYDMQAKLLRVLEDGEIIPVGSNKPKKVDMKVVAATHVNLQEKIANGQFRQDLYFRLANFTIEIPPLRERKEDIFLLAEHFIEIFSEKMGREKPHLDSDALHTLQNYSFPGNIRELKNIIENALIRCDGGVITSQNINLIHSSTAKITHAIPHCPDEYFVQSRSDEEIIINYLKQHKTINNTQCRNLLNSDLNRASYLLKKMYKEETLSKEGQRRWSRYRLAEG